MPSATTITVTGTLEAPDGTQAQGTVVFTPIASGAHFANNGVSVVNTPRIIGLVGGALPGGFALARCPGGYTVVENVTGGTPYGPYTIPDQAGPVDLSAFH